MGKIYMKNVFFDERYRFVWKLLSLPIVFFALTESYHKTL